MPRQVTPSQLRSMIRQAEAKQRQAVNQYNSAVRQYNNKLKQAIDEHNANVRRAQRAVSDHNRAVDAHNSRVRADRHRLQREIRRLNGQRSSARFTVTQTSTIALHTAYRRVEDDFDAGLMGARGGPLVDLAEAEAANSARVTNSLLGQPADEDLELEGTALTNELSALSEDLDQRWRGALFSLNPRNPEAARHFCTSAREVILQMIDLKASDATVLQAVPGCDKAKDGKPARRAKIGYLLACYGEDHESLRDFVEADVDDVIGLVREVNNGTHGSAGRYDLPTLRAIKSRVEGSVRFLSTMIRGI